MRAVGLALDHPDGLEARHQAKLHEGAVAISALAGDGIDDFLRVLSDRLRALTSVVELLVPFDRGDVLAAVHREGEVLATVEDDEGLRVRARVEPAAAGRLAEFVAPARLGGA